MHYLANYTRDSHYFVYTPRPTLEGIGGGVATVIILGPPPIAVIAYLKRREEKRLKEVGIDPYLLSAREKVIAMERYFRG